MNLKGTIVATRVRVRAGQILKSVILPIGRVQSKRTRVIQVFADQHLSVLAVQTGHFNSVGAGIRPVEVSTHPVHSHSLRIVQAKLNDWFNQTAIHEGSADSLKK